MADHILKSSADFIENGPVAGQSLQSFHSNLHNLGSNIETLTEQQWTSSVSGLLNGSGAESKTDIFIAPVPLEITSIQALRDSTSASAATCALTVRASDNPLTATNISVNGLTDVTLTNQALSATASKYTLAAGDRLKVAWVTDSSGTITAATCVIKWKPIA